MTTYERFEREIPRLMDELAPSSLPDYLDDMLRQTERTSQRPAWSALERWLPMDALTGTTRTRLPMWQVLALVALLAVALVASAIAVGSRWRSDPSASPLAGLLIATDPQGDLVTVDPATGATAPLASTDGTVTDPVVSPDGHRIAMLDRTSEFRQALVVMDADGTDQQVLFDPDTDLYTPLWAPDGRRIMIFRGDRDPALSLIDIETQAVTEVATDPALGEVHAIASTPDGDWLITTNIGDLVGFAIVDDTGATVRAFEIADAMNEPVLSADGRTMAYTTWGGPEGDGRTHIVDLTSSADRLVSPRLAEAFNELGPVLSPDGSLVLVQRFTASNDPGYDLILMDLATGEERQLGPTQPPDVAAASAFAPDGRSVVVGFGGDVGTWRFDVATGEGQPLVADLGPELVWPDIPSP